MSLLVPSDARFACASLAPPRPAAGSESYRLFEWWAEAVRHFSEPSTRDRPTLEEELAALAEWWRRDTVHMSSVIDMVTHPAYQRIIGKGHTAVPFLLRELASSPDHWFWALNAITGVDPVAPQDLGRIKKMAEAWIQWGKEQGLI